MPTIQELQQRIKSAEDDRQLAKIKIANLKSHLSERESELIEATIAKERAIEALDFHERTTVYVEVTEREVEIEGFRNRFPELCQKKENNGS
jgi:hypothetical protein